MRISRIIFIVVLVSLLAFCSGCVERSPEGQANTSVTESVPVEPDAVVYIDNFEFYPFATTISSGETVQWINNNSAAIIIKGSLVGGDSFQSGTLRINDTFNYTFVDAGTYEYKIATHPWTRGGQVGGKIIVE